MKYLSILLLLLSLITINTIGCYYDNEEELYPEVSSCDTAAVSYSTKLLPIIEDQCIGCHSAAAYQAAGGGYNLEGYTNVKASVDDNTFLPAINHSGNFPMPKGGNKLDNCTIAQFEAWINAGAPNN
jgi:mono/diheme cytochrome c family protein